MQTVVRDEQYLKNAEKIRNILNIMQYAFMHMHNLNAIRILDGKVSEQNIHDIAENTVKRVSKIIDSFLDNDEVSQVPEIVTEISIALCEDFMSVAKKK